METVAGNAMQPILDASGKVREWMTAGRGVRLWRSQELGANRPDLFTPGDTTQPPHWAYAGSGTLLDDRDIVFYQKGPIYFDGARYFEWTDTPAGWRAANAAVDGLPTDNGDAPIRLSFAYTVERVFYQTEEKDANGRPCGLHYRVAIIRWSAPRD